MKLKYLLGLILVFQYSAYAQPAIQWQKSFGGSSDDKAYSVQQTFDGGYIVAGYSLSMDGDVTGNHGGDNWILKLDGSGNIEWKECIGGTGVDNPYSIKQTTDSGFFVVGYTTSKDGDVTGLHGANADYWVVKLSSTGTIEWEKALGGTGDDKAYSGQQTTDGGYIVAGYSASKDGDVTGNHSIYTGADDWIVKLDNSGNIQWAKCYGGSANDYAESIQQTFDRGYIVTGYTYSNDSEVTGNHGDWDYWVIRLDTAGELQWQQCLGGSKIEESYSIFQTSDSGYLVAGLAASNDSEVSGNHWTYGPYSDCWVVKLDQQGAIQWQKCYGGTNDDWAQCISLTKDGGFIIAAETYSNDNQFSGNHSSPAYSDYGILKADSTGTYQWHLCLGGTADDQVYSVQETSDGGFIIAGFTNSTDGDVTSNYGGYDYWVVKLAAPLGVSDADAGQTDLDISPNPFTYSSTLRLNKQVNEAEVVIFDILGKEILRKNLTGTTMEIDRGNLADGIYFVRVIAGQRQWLKKMVIE